MERVRFYGIVTICGAVIMALEILSSRLLAPQFGNSVYVWGSIISVFLAALSAGYYLGGKIADRAPRLEVLAKVILLAAMGELVLLFAGGPLVTFFGQLTGGSPYGTLLATAALFGPVSVLLATVSPFAVRLATRDVASVGNTAGRLYAVSTGGSLVGTLGCTFGLIPFLELSDGLALLVLATVVASGLGLAGSARHEKPAVALAVLVVVLVALGQGDESRWRGSFVGTRVTPYQTLDVFETGGVRYLKSDRAVQSGVRLADGEPGIAYPRYAAAVLLWRPEIDRALVIGLGAGSVGAYLQRRLDGLSVDYVEIDPAVAEIAEEQFFFRTGELTRVHVDDGRRFLAAAVDQRWDLIYCDTFIGAAIPFHLTTREFFSTASERLSPGGVLAVNLTGDLSHRLARAIFVTLRQSFSTVEAIAVPPGNLLLVATNQPAAPPIDELRRRAAELDERWSFEPSLSEILATRQAVEVSADDAIVLEDRFAPVNYLVGFERPLAEQLPEAVAPDAAETPGD